MTGVCIDGNLSPGRSRGRGRIVIINADSGPWSMDDHESCCSCVFEKEPGETSGKSI